MDLEVRHLRYLEAVENAGSVTKAAAALGLSQPSLAAQVRRVEDLVGSRVFDRSRQGCAPTALGDLLLTRARDVLGAVEEMTAAIARFHDASANRMLYLGTRSTVLASRLGEVASAVFPGRPIDLAVLDRQEAALTALADGSADVVLHVDFPGRELVPPAGTRLLPVGREPVFLLVPEGQAAGPELDLAELAGRTWLLWASGDDEMNRHLVTECERAGIGTPVIRDHDLLTAGQVLRRGDFVVMPVQPLDGGGGLPGRACALRGSPLRFRHVLVWREGVVDVERIEALRDGLRSAYRLLVAERGRIPAWWAGNPGWLGSASP
ncbi:LysR family transcriptional regulator [Amycolatopsis pittospori]|uniref:LysR family transcriptional regulator n=1 Tax=Amycolatopsis pittospori TaxID=2749434 RepID=UPI0015F06AD1|nr:LysR family transcriptional regulator [Amycolatopsis pittospori]